MKGKKRDEVRVEREHGEREAVTAATQVDPLQLKKEFVEIASLLATFNEQYAEALRKHLRAKRRKEETYARVYLEKRETTEEKLTEGMLKAMVESDEEYEMACRWAIDAEIEKVRAGGRCEALRAKKDALISLGAHVRAELSGDPKLRDYQAAQDME